ncbi:MAG: lipoprotein signal peptidase [Vicingaceae bacterium]
MKQKNASSRLALVVIFIVLLIDQISKFWIKTHLEISEEIPVFGDWFIIHFTENNGMAFGLEIAGDYGKLILSVFRIIAVSLIGYYLFSLPKKGASKGLIISGSLIFAGALGNIIDSAFYGLIFNDSYYQVASFLPEEGGYAPFLFGRVVDMLYFPIYEGFLPAWVPFWGSEYFIFFRPVFNIADSAITVGVISILLFHRGFFKD